MIEKILLFRELHTEAFLFFIFITFASIGSFLNVVIYRLPKIIDYEWMKDAEAYLSFKKIKHEKFNYPKEKPNLNGLSHCPQCNKKIPFYYNIPILGWVILKGKTACCQNKLSSRYPFVEFIVASFATLSFLFFDIYYALFASIVATILTAIFFIDKDHQIIPDSLLVLLFSSIITFTGFNENIDTFTVMKDALITFFILFSFSALYSKIRGIQGMGMGDIKLIAIATSFFGLIYLPVYMLVSVFIFIFMAITGSISEDAKKHSVEGAMPFGPALAISFIAMVYFYSYLKYIY